MKRYQVHFADEAWQSIQAQVRCIAVENNAPENASRWLARVVDAVDALEQFPDRHGVDEAEPDLHGVELRRMVFERTYLVFYAIDEGRNCVNIVSFRHGARHQK